MKNRKLILLLLVLALVVCADIQPAIAYFTTFTYAKGGHPIYLRDTTRIEEQFSKQTKHVKIRSEANSSPVWVRAKVFYAYQGIEEIIISGNPSPEESSKWQEGAKDGNGYVYYNYLEPLPGGDVTEELTVTIKTKETLTPEAGDQYDVIVVYESTPVRYDENGKVIPVDWNAPLYEYDNNGNLVPVANSNEEGNG